MPTKGFSTFMTWSGKGGKIDCKPRLEELQLLEFQMTKPATLVIRIPDSEDGGSEGELPIEVKMPTVISLACGPSCIFSSVLQKHPVLAKHVQHVERSSFVKDISGAETEVKDTIHLRWCLVQDGKSTSWYKSTFIILDDMPSCPFQSIVGNETIETIMTVWRHLGFG